jgi:hypothetical protein
MHPVLRAVLLVFGSMFASLILRAQSAELPPIFAPRTATVSPRVELPATSAAPSSSVSARARSLMQTAATRVLADAEVFDASSPGAVKEMFLDPASGTMVMAPMIVRAKLLQDSDVRPPTVRLFHWGPAEGDKYRRLAGGVTGPIYHTFIGNKEFQADFNILNGAGRGIDHGRDFTRVELSFTLKF